MSKILAEFTSSLILEEVKKDVTDINMGDIGEYKNTLISKVNRYLDSVEKCKHTDISKQLTVVGTDTSGKKALEYRYICSSCGRTWANNPNMQ